MCERSLLAQDGEHVVPLAAPLRIRWHVRSSEPLSLIGGIDWHPEEELLAVLDMMLSRVIVMDTLGVTRLTFGREGPGPGELNFVGLAMRGTARNRLAAFPEGFALADSRGIQWYARNGKYLATLQTYRTPLVATYDVHLARAYDRLLASRSGKGDVNSSDPHVRTMLSVEGVVPDDSSTWTTVLALRNSWVQFAGLDMRGYPAQRPYLNSHGRTWDGNGGLLVAISYDRYGVWFFGESAALYSSFAVKLAPRKVDRAERERELRRHTLDPDEKLPFLGVSQRQLFEGKWATYMPRYIDVVLGSDSTAWALRWGGDSAIADICITPARGIAAP